MSSNLAKSAFWVTVSEIIFNLSGFVIHSVVGRILGPADYGRYGLIITLTTMVIILIGNGIPTAMSKYISEIFESNPAMVRVIKRQAIILQSIIISVVTVIFFFSAQFIARILNDSSLIPLFQLSTLIIPLFAAASFYFSYFTGLHKFNVQSFLKISRSIFRIVFIIGFAYYFSLKGAISGYIAAPASVFLLALFIDRFYIARKLRKKEIEIIRRDVGLISTTEVKLPQFDWRKLVSYAWQIIIFFLAYELLISIDLYLVKGILQDDYLTGIYNASLTIGRIPYYVFYALTVILLPVISKTNAENNIKKTCQVIGQSLRFMLILLVPSVILMSVFARPLTRLFYSHRYIDAAYPMSILVWGVGFLTIYYVLCFVMSGAGRVKIPLYISILGLALNTILNYFMIKSYGIVGSAVATSITSVVITIIMLRYLWNYFGVGISPKTLIKIFLAGAVMYKVATYFPKQELMFLLWSAILFVFYFALLFILREIKKEDLSILKKIISRKKVSEVEEEFSGSEPSA